MEGSNSKKYAKKKESKASPPNELSCESVLEGLSRTVERRKSCAENKPLEERAQESVRRRCATLVMPRTWEYGETVFLGGTFRGGGETVGRLVQGATTPRK